MKLNKEMIEAPEMWAMTLRVALDALTVLLRGPESCEQSVICHRIDLAGPSASGLCRAVEEAVYANPLLLSDFRSVSVSIVTQEYALLPTEAAAEAETVARALNPDPEQESDVVTCTLGARGELTLAMLVHAELLNFLRRTFANPALHHPLEAVATYMAHTNALGDPERTYALTEPGALTLVAFGADNGLTLANRYVVDSPQAAAYFCLGCADPARPLLVGGPAELRNELTALLRPYCPHLMPMTLSADMLHLLSSAPAATPDLLMLALM